jgi:hypothetical protein
LNKFLFAAVAALTVGFAYLANDKFDFANQKAAVLPMPANCDTPPSYEKQIINLPEDGQAYHTSLWLPQNWEQNKQAREMVAWFETNPQLRSLKAQTHFHIYEQGSRMYENRYRQMIPKVPAVTVQKSTGQFVYEAGLTNSVPSSATALAADIQGNVYSNCPNRKPKPEPTPEPDPVDKGPPKVLEPPAVTEGLTDKPIFLILSALFVGGLAGLGSAYYEQYYKQKV